MCSEFLKNMENYQGDLADIIRATGGGAVKASARNINPGEVSTVMDWQFPSNQIDYDYPSGVEEPLDEFGDPFSNIRDPLLQDIDMSSSGFFNSSNSSTDIIHPSIFENTENFGGDGSSSSSNNNILTQKIVADHDQIRRPSNNIFSRMLQISPNAKLSTESPRDSSVALSTNPPRGVKLAPMLVSNEMINTTVNSSKGGSFVENAGQVQISSPRNTGIKRRKSQAKKVVCIPAPAPANSRPSGEIVPSDLWAWRKYGQKPIKGSPYPRGYYRCSSSKGCSARKQVERSRTDPNMLVITYTSEHNHPWPTQRNALAGSTRMAQPSKSGSTSKTSTSSEAQKSTILKEEPKESHTDNISSLMVTENSTICSSVKEEAEHLHKQIEMDNVEFSDGFRQSYKPALPDTNQSEDFFADLGELEGDPLNLLFSQGYSGDHDGQNKSLDPFNFYDWACNSTTSTNNNRINNTSVNEAKKGGSSEDD